MVEQILSSSDTDRQNTRYKYLKLEHHRWSQMLHFCIGKANKL
jgi:hypothetical protein